MRNFIFLFRALKISASCLTYHQSSSFSLFNYLLGTRMSHSLSVSATTKGEDVRYMMLPPASVRGMVALDRTLFKKPVQVPCMHLDSISKIAFAASRKSPLKKYVLRLDNMKPLQALDGSANDNIVLDGAMIDPSSKNKILLLNPKLISSFNDIAEADRVVLSADGITEETLKFLTVYLTYENWKADEILRAVLPEDKDSVASYSKIGHIIHLNLRDHVAIYKKLIGEVLLDKISGARTIVNKLDNIDSTYRNFQMEILSGENDMMAVVHENYCTFEFDFSTVYWNPRLSTEHERITKMLKSGDILYDVFAGVGPFAVPAGKKNCMVLANDLNPESFRWLKHNAKKNKVSSSVETFNKDGADFIKKDLKEDMLKRWKSGLHTDNRMHITMNLPALAETFISNFYGLFANEDLESLDIKNYPIVHLYCFAKGENPVALARAKFEEHMGIPLTSDILQEIFNVRTVSSMKEMMRVSFLLSREILVGSAKKTAANTSAETSLDEPPLKKLCTLNHGETNCLFFRISRDKEWKFVHRRCEGKF